jgi:hypothetical protein
MVSKLQLAVYEVCKKAIEANESEVVIGKLLEHYYEINEGIGVHKSPALYGAFPTDPYSHTPLAKGAQQPGMTGQVKEDILSRMGELGVSVNEGKLRFNPVMLRQNEFLSEEAIFNYIDVSNEKREERLYPGMLAFTYCQVPVIYRLNEKDSITIVDAKGHSSKMDGDTLDEESSAALFNRTATIEKVVVDINQKKLK